MGSREHPKPRTSQNTFWLQLWAVDKVWMSALPQRITSVRAASSRSRGLICRNQVAEDQFTEWPADLAREGWSGGFSSPTPVSALLLPLLMQTHQLG